MSRKCNSFIKDATLWRSRLTIKQIKSCSKNKSGTTLIITNKNFQDGVFPHELFLTTKQKTDLRNVFANNMSTDIKLSKSQLSKII